MEDTIKDLFTSTYQEKEEILGKSSRKDKSVMLNILLTGSAVY